VRVGSEQAVTERREADSADPGPERKARPNRISDGSDSHDVLLGTAMVAPRV